MQLTFPFFHLFSNEYIYFSNNTDLYFFIKLCKTFVLIKCFLVLTEGLVVIPVICDT